MSEPIDDHPASQWCVNCRHAVRAVSFCSVLGCDCTDHRAERWCAHCGAPESTHKRDAKDCAYFVASPGEETYG